MKNKIFFFMLDKESPLSNVKVFLEFKNQFSEFEVIGISIKEIFKKNYLLILKNLFFVVKIYGIKSIFNKKKLGHFFYLTPYIFIIIKKYCENLIKNNNCFFSFQMQSMFDASYESIPHFVYTDHTHLTNLSYKDFNIKNMVHKNRLNLEKSIYKNANIIFTRSRNVTNDLIKQYGISSEKIKCVLAGYNHPISRNIEKKYDNKNILFVGKDWERKGGDDLILAFKKVIQLIPDAKLIIVGSNPNINHPSITLIGKIELSKIDYYYLNAQIFCLPTKIEPFGISFLEAMSCKLPVIGSNIGAIPDFIEHGSNGYLINPGNTELLSKYLIELLNDSDKCKRFGEIGYQKIIQNYNWKMVVSKIKKFTNEKLFEN